MNEAYLATARSRVSLARHARLLDYHVHQGNQASTWVALRADRGRRDPAGRRSIEVWAGRESAGVPADDAAVVPRCDAAPAPAAQRRARCTRGAAPCPALAAGAVAADLAMPSQAAAERGRGADRDRRGRRGC